MHHPTDKIAHMAFSILVMQHWLEQEIAQWIHHEGSSQWPIAKDLVITSLYNEYGCCLF